MRLPHAGGNDPQFPLIAVMQGGDTGRVRENVMPGYFGWYLIARVRYPR